MSKIYLAATLLFACCPVWAMREPVTLFSGSIQPTIKRVSSNVSPENILKNKTYVSQPPKKKYLHFHDIECQMTYRAHEQPCECLEFKVTRFPSSSDAGRLENIEEDLVAIPFKPEKLALNGARTFLLLAGPECDVDHWLDGGSRDSFNWTESYACALYSLIHKQLYSLHGYTGAQKIGFYKNTVIMQSGSTRQQWYLTDLEEDEDSV